MARKVCPGCNKLNGGSATVCECGHAFAATSIVAATRTTKRCPKCRNEQPLMLAKCGCGHTFEDIVELRTDAINRIHAGWANVVLGLVVLGACVAIAIVTKGAFIIIASAGIYFSIRGLTMRADAKVLLRQIDRATVALPSAKIV